MNMKASRNHGGEPDFDLLLEQMLTRADLETHPPAKQARFAEFPPREYFFRYARARALMELYEIDALLLSQEINVRYFSGFLTLAWCSRFRPYLVLLPRDASVAASLIVPTMEAGNARYTSWVPDATVFPAQEDPVPYIADVIKTKLSAGAKIGTELGFGQRLGMTTHQLDSLRAAIAPGSFVDGTPVTQAVRMIKSPAEVARLRRACEISQAGVQAGWEALRPGMTEKELAAVMASTMFAEGAEFGTQPSFLTLFAGPERYRMPNTIASDYELSVGDLIVIDGGAVYGGYATDFIRQASLGEPTRDQRRWFEICVDANDAAIDAIQPGRTGADVYEAAMSVFQAEGVLEYNLVNIVGHGTGMEVHELPWLGERDRVYTTNTTLRPGMVVCIEPVIAGMDGSQWRSGMFIVEDKVLVTEHGHEVLTAILPKELWIQPVAP
jgi:Xaa-Pro aminopeptidase